MNKVIIDGKFDNLSFSNNDGISRMKISLPQFMSSPGNYGLAVNNTGKTLILLFFFLEQDTFATVEGTLFPLTSVSASDLPANVSSSASVGSNSNVPRRQEISIFRTSDTFRNGFLAWEPNELLSINLSANPLGLTGKITLVYMPL